MALGLAAFQTVLNDGNVYNWFDSPFIVKLSLVAALALGAFVLWQFMTPAPLVKFRLLGRRNFGLGTLGTLRLCLSAAAIPRCRTRLRRRTDRRGRGLDGVAPAPGDTARAAF